MTERALTYDDVLLEPGYTRIESRREVDTSVTLGGNINLDVPIISANMDTITGPELATELAENGAIGCLPRFKPIEEQVADVHAVEGPVIASVGVSKPPVKCAEQLVDAGADAICLDVPQAHSKQVIDAAGQLAQRFTVPIIAGNVATTDGAHDLVKAGVDVVKVGIGPGSHCKTREVTGVGVPQFTAVRNAVEGIRDAGYEDEAQIIADGGIKSSGDLAKAVIGGGAHFGMIGGLFGQCESAAAPTHSPDGETLYNATRGMASQEARDDADHLDTTDQRAIEGDSAFTKVTTTVEELLTEYKEALRSTCGYVGGRTIPQARHSAEYCVVTQSSIPRAGVHGAPTQRDE